MLTVITMIFVKALPVLLAIFNACLASLFVLIPFTIKKAYRIPGQIKILLSMAKDERYPTSLRIVIVSVLVLVALVLKAMVFSIIPFTAIPVLGVFPFAVASMLSLVLVIFAWDYILKFCANDSYCAEHFGKTHGVDFEDFKNDFESAKRIVDKHLKGIDKIIRDFVKQNEEYIFENAKKMDIKVDAFLENILDAICPSLEVLKVYIRKNKSIVVEANDIKLIEERLAASKKFSIAMMAGTGTGLASASVAGTIFVQANLINQTLAFFGLGGSSIVLGGGAFTAATVVAPVAFGVAVSFGVVYGLKAIERSRLSNFLADIGIVSISMICVDGVIDERELNVIKAFVVNNSILDKNDKEKVLIALENPQEININYIVKHGLLNESDESMLSLKGRLVLSLCLSVAYADGVYRVQEKKHLEALRTIFGIDDDYVLDVAKLINITSPKALGKD